ncbi:hypothetical protein BDV12DRAFT_172112 [Aspergillus spectabilis]
MGLNMASPAQTSFHPFALLTNKLILLPTPIAISIRPYRKMYAGVHATPDFCNMAFGEHFAPQVWSDDDTREVIQSRDIARCWERRGMGDFTVGVYEEGLSAGRKLGLVDEDGHGTRLVEGEDYLSLVGQNSQYLDRITWVGYAGVRDATTTSMPERTLEDPVLPPWQEMVELRYGVAQECWGKGVAREAATMVMQWAVRECGVRRFIAETERENVRSGRVLEKMGFVLSGMDYWKEPSELEWEKVIS